MTAAREEMLERVSRALADRPAQRPVVRDYHSGPATPVPTARLIELFTARLLDYRALVRTTEAAGIPAAVAAALATRGARRVVAPPGLPVTITGALVATTFVRDEPVLSAAELDEVDGVLTMCAVAIAETGTIVLDGGPGQGRRALSLVPDYHLVVVRAQQIVATVPEAVALLEPTRPMTWISGPSATSDIELSRVEGVHGPRTLEVLLAL